MALRRKLPKLICPTMLRKHAALRPQGPTTHTDHRQKDTPAEDTVRQRSQQIQRATEKATRTDIETPNHCGVSPNVVHVADP